MTKMDDKKNLGTADIKQPVTTQFHDSRPAKSEPHGAAKVEDRTNSPTTDMQNLVLDLNSFLSSTQKEIHTPKSTKKKYSNSHNGKKEESYDNNFKFGAKTQLTDRKAEKWSCQKCTLINSAHLRICSVCGASRNFEKAEATIFDPPEVPHQDEQEEEQMPQKGNVLDKVVQFTAMQMIAREIPAAKPSLPIGMINFSLH